MGLFSLKEPEKEIEKPNSLCVAKYMATHLQKIQSLEKDLFRLPMNNEFFFLQTDTAFNAFTFIPFIAKYKSIKNLYACTYSISRRVIETLVELHDQGKIEQITLLISDSMIKRNPLTIENLKAMCSTRPNIQVLYAWTHAKVCLMETAEDYYIVEGSGNWAENAHYEQYILANDYKVFEFRKELFTNTNIVKY